MAGKPPFSDLFEERIARLAVDFSLGHSNELPSWLSHITGQPVEESDGTWVVHGPGGMTIGLGGTDPITTAVSAGMAIAGMWWPFVFPELLDKTNKYWAEAKRESITHAREGGDPR